MTAEEERKKVALIGLALHALGDGLYKAGTITDDEIREQALDAAIESARAVLR